MRVKSRRLVKVPPAVQEAIDAIVRPPTKDVALIDVLRAFRWKEAFESNRSERGEFGQWLELFNFFDDWFDENTSSDELQFTLPRAGSTDGAAGKPNKAFPAELCLEVLRVSRSILDSCSNKHAYSSLDHLANLAVQDQN